MWIFWGVLGWTILSMPLAIICAKRMKRVSMAYDEYEPKEAHPVILPRDSAAALAALEKFSTVQGQVN